MKQYLDLIRDVYENGHDSGDRTGTGKRSVFSREMRFNLRDSFPIVTAKKTNFDFIKQELIWLLSGVTNIKFLTDHNNPIWDAWADKFGNLGPVYGAQWRRLKKYTIGKSNGFTVDDDGTWHHQGASVTVETIDQIQNAIDTLKNDPTSRRIIVNAWNVADLDDMALPPCHAFFQFYARPLSCDERCELLSAKITLRKAWQSKGCDKLFEQRCEDFNIPKYALSCKLTQRSADLFLGVPFNIASYALLTHIIAQCTNMLVDEFIWSGGDCHLYLNHLEQVEELLAAPTFELPQLKIHNPLRLVNSFGVDDFELINYQHGAFIKAPVAV